MSIKNSIRYSLLIVDDMKSIRLSLQDILAVDYDVFVSASGEEALQTLKKTKVDLMITDINMPGMDGITLIKKAKKKFPHLICVLITAYNIDKYLTYVRIEKIKNIIPKASIANLLNFRICIKKLLGEIDIFGIKHYFPQIEIQEITGTNICRNKLHHEKHVYRVSVESFNDYRLLAHKIWNEFFSTFCELPIISLILEELCSNVIKHLYFRDKIIKSDNIKFQKRFQPPFDLLFGCYEGSIIISVVDYIGLLDQKKILKALEVQAENETLFIKNIPPTLKKIINQGRGLYLSRELSSQMIFNIQKHVKTEVISIISPEQVRSRIKTYSSFYIFEKNK